MEIGVCQIERRCPHTERSITGLIFPFFFGTRKRQEWKPGVRGGFTNSTAPFCRRVLTSSWSKRFLSESLVTDMFRETDNNGGRLWNWSSRPPSPRSTERTHLSEVISCHWFRKWANLPPTGIWGKGVGQNSSSSGDCTNGGGGPSLTILFPLYHFGFFTCGREGISSSWSLAIPWRFSRALLHRASFWMELRSSDSSLPIRNLDIYKKCTFTVCGVLLTSSWSLPNGRPNNLSFTRGENKRLRNGWSIQHLLSLRQGTVGEGTHQKELWNIKALVHL